MKEWIYDHRPYFIEVPLKTLKHRQVQYIPQVHIAMDESEFMQVSCPAVHILTHCFRMLCEPPVWLTHLPFSLFYIVYQGNLDLILKWLLDFVFVLLFYFQKLIWIVELTILWCLFSQSYQNNNYTAVKESLPLLQDLPKFHRWIVEFHLPFTRISSGLDLLNSKCNFWFFFLCCDLCPLIF